MMEGLKEKQAELRAVEEALQALANRLVECENQKSALEKQVLDCTSRLDRAEKLIRGLGGEQSKWTAEAEVLRVIHQNLTGDTLLSAAFVAYLGPFGAQDRVRIFKEWKSIADRHGLQTSSTIDVLKTLGNTNSMRVWKLAGLSSDAHSVQNAVIAERSQRWPLMVDPHNIARDWIMQTAKKSKKEIKIVDVNQPTFTRVVEAALEQGRTLIIEGVCEELDPMLDPVLLKQISRRGGHWCISYGGRSIKYNDHFKLFLLSSCAGPDFPPSIFLKTKVIDCSMTQECLHERLLSFVVMKELPDIEEQKQSMDEQSADNDRQLKELEDKILLVLSSSSGNILDDSTAIEVLTRSKLVADNINVKQGEIYKNREELDGVRYKYNPVAKRSSSLFYCITSMSRICPSYQFSSHDFIHLFLQALGSDTSGNSDVRSRTTSINDSFLELIHNRVCVAFFLADQMLFKLLVATAFEQFCTNRAIDPEEFKFFSALQGKESLAVSGSPTEMYKEIPRLEDPSCPAWLPQEVYKSVSVMSSQSEQLKWVFPALGHASQIWQAFFESDDPFRHDMKNEGGGYVRGFQKVCLVKAFRPDKVQEAVAAYISDQLGAKYMHPPTVSLEETILTDNDEKAVFVFVVSELVDPTAKLDSLANSQGLELLQVSLGDGKMAKAEQAIAEGREAGNWVVLHNCHLCPQWMGRLEQLCNDILTESAASSKRSGFRLMLVTDCTSIISHSLFKKCVKIACDQPKGLKARALDAMQNKLVSEGKNQFDGNSSKADVYTRLALAVCQFHAHVHEIVRHSPSGWHFLAVAYGQDLCTVLALIRNYVASNAVENSDTVLRDIMHLVGDCVYGGHASNEDHQILMLRILRSYVGTELGRIAQETPNTESKEDDDGNAIAGLAFNQAGFLACAESISGDIFGGAGAGPQRDAALYHSFRTALLPDSAHASATQSVLSVDHINAARDACTALLLSCPLAFDIDMLRRKFPVSGTALQNIILYSEVASFNILIGRIRGSLKNLMLALSGKRYFENRSDGRLARNILENALPQEWAQVSYVSTKPLRDFMHDLSTRVQYIQKEWINAGRLPKLFWGGCMFDMSPLCDAICQDFARREHISTHDTKMDATLVYADDPLLQTSSGQRDLSDGVFVSGIFASGATWSDDGKELAPNNKLSVFEAASNHVASGSDAHAGSPMPHVWLRPYRSSEGTSETQRDVRTLVGVVMQTPEGSADKGNNSEVSVECPLYNECRRNGKASQHRNQKPVLYVSIPIKEKTWCSREEWLTRGTVLSCHEIE